MALLYEEFKIAEPIVINDFSKFFNPISKARTTITWLEKGKIQIKMPRYGSTTPYYAGPGAVLGTLGAAGGVIPTTIPRATWNMVFRFLKEDRLTENVRSNFLFWGQEYTWAIGFGMTQWPLFEVALSAANNHLYIRFNGWYGSPFQYTYPFHAWSVDLGPIENFYKWTNFTVWVDSQQKAFVKIIIGGKEVPFPEGYTVIKPDKYANTIFNGLLAGDLTNDACTNLTVEVGGVQIWGEYYTPPAPGAGLPWWPFALVGVGAAIVVGTQLKKEKKR